MKTELSARHASPDSVLEPVPSPEIAAAVPGVAPADGAAALPAGATFCAQPPSTKRSRQARRARPGWKPTLVRKGSFQKLRAIQKSSCDRALDLSCLSDACIALALELGAQRIVERALADLRVDLRARRSASTASHLSEPSSQSPQLSSE